MVPAKIYSLDEIRRMVAPIAAKYDVDRVFLFGSYARGEAACTSDLDFVIDKGRLRGLKLAAMLGDLQETFDRPIDLLTSSGLAGNGETPEFRRKVERERVVVYEQ